MINDNPKLKLKTVLLLPISCLAKLYHKRHKPYTKQKYLSLYQPPSLYNHHTSTVPS